MNKTPSTPTAGNTSKQAWVEKLATSLESRANEIYRAGSRDHDDMIVGRTLTVAYSELAEMLRAAQDGNNEGAATRVSAQEKA